MKAFLARNGRFIAILACGLLLWVAVGFFTGTMCWVQATTGFPCPGCGSTRAVFLLAEGDLAGALNWHPLILLSLVVIPYLAIRHTIFKKKPVPNIEKYIFIGIGFLYMSVFAIRMILFFPHTPPMEMYEHTVVRRLIAIIFGVSF
ncbi:MAG: DUF2752 domain-containing protein [Defluviitaleaceae bacterium]|nr:DUF2752 domain-containing protein [Defluviitaleaceae bacterium]